MERQGEKPRNVRTGLVVTIGLVVISSGLPWPGAFAGPTSMKVVLPPADDTYVDHGGPDDNYDGSELMLLTDHHSVYGAEDSRYILIGIDLDVSSAQLVIGATEGSIRAVLVVPIVHAGCAPGPICDYDPTSGGYALYRIEDDAWSEETVTFANAPAAGDLIEMIPYAGSNRDYRFDVTDWLIEQVSHSDLRLSFKLRIEDPGVQKYNFVPPKEMGGNSIRLELIS